MQLWMLDIPDSPGEQKPRIERIPTSGRYPITLAVSPDGKLALVAEVDSGVKLTTIALEGGTQRQIASSDDLTSVTSLAWSPDGTEIAMTAYRRQDGRLVLYRVPTTGGTLQTDGLPVGDVLAWAPSAQLFVQMNGNQNFQVIDPATSQSQPLLTDLDGWHLYPNISPNGRTIAFLWSRMSIKALGIGLISIADRSVRFLEQGDFRPVGFSPDGTLVYAAEPSANPKKLVAISIATSAVTPLATLPFETGLQEIVVIPGTSRFVCLVNEGGPDLWVAEGFDPEAAAP